MRRIYGRKCSLSLMLDGFSSVALPYCEETIREAVSGYFLPPALEGNRKSAFFATGSEITGCFITRLDDECAIPLLSLLESGKIRFTLIQDHVCKKKKYTGIFCKTFSIFAEHGKAVYLKCEVGGDRLSKAADTEEDCSVWSKNKTFLFNGKEVFADGKRLPQVYRIELKGNLEKNSGYELLLYSPLSFEFFPCLNKIEKITVPLNLEKSVFIELNGLIPAHDLCDINCADSILSARRFFVDGKIQMVY